VIFHRGLPHLKARKRRAVQHAPKPITLRTKGSLATARTAISAVRSSIHEGAKHYAGMIDLAAIGHGSFRRVIPVIPFSGKLERTGAAVDA
jgi:hypothetical protein